MKKTFSKDYMLQHGGCYVEDSPGKVESLFFYSGNESITIADILNADIPLKDKFWFIVNKTGLCEEITNRITIDVTNISLPFYGDRLALQKAIDIATSWINREITIYDLYVERDDMLIRHFGEYSYESIKSVLHFASYSAAYFAIKMGKECSKLLYNYLVELVNSQPED